MHWVIWLGDTHRQYDHIEFQASHLSCFRGTQGILNSIFSALCEMDVARGAGRSHCQVVLVSSIEWWGCSFLREADSGPPFSDSGSLTLTSWKGVTKKPLARSDGCLGAMFCLDYQSWLIINRVRVCGCLRGNEVLGSSLLCKLEAEQ